LATLQIIVVNSQIYCFQTVLVWIVYLYCQPLHFLTNNKCHNLHAHKEIKDHKIKSFQFVDQCRGSDFHDLSINFALRLKE
jgi:hypothetical protein